MTSAQNKDLPTKTNQDVKSAGSELKELTYTTAAYKREVLRLLIAEANDVAAALKLPENLPITQRDLIYIVVGPPRLAELTGGTIGTIGTSNYEYSVALSNKLSYIVSSKLDSEEARDKIKAEYLWPIARRDTNAAYRLATNWLGTIQMDVKKIERDCKVSIWSWTPDDADGKHFVPLYIIVWKMADGPVASVELLEPTRLLGQLRVEKPEYILRPPVVVTNAEMLLSRTNLPVKNAP